MIDHDPSATQGIKNPAAHFARERAAYGVHAEVAEIQRFVASLPTRDSRSADEILGYDGFGLPR